MTPREVEAMARAIHASDDHGLDWADETAFGRSIYRENVTAALTALCAIHPGILDVIEGRAVVVPREATEEMIEAGFDAADGWFEIDGDKGPWLRSDGFAAAYAAMLASSPYATPPAADGNGA